MGPRAETESATSKTAISRSIPQRLSLKIPLLGQSVHVGVSFLSPIFLSLELSACNSLAKYSNHLAVSRRIPNRFRLLHALESLRIPDSNRNIYLIACSISYPNASAGLHICQANLSWYDGLNRASIYSHAGTKQHDYRL